MRFLTLTVVALASSLALSCSPKQQPPGHAAPDGADDDGAVVSGTHDADSDLGDSGFTEAARADDVAALCGGSVTSDLPGVSFEFPDDRCSYTLAEVAAGITLKYEINILQSLAGIHPAPTDYGSCQTPDASGLIVGFEVADSSQRYCLCDVGPCMRQTFNTRLLVGTQAGEIRWDGRNWLGGSDTGNPKGAAFPVGTYILTLTAKGTWDGPAASDAGAPHADSGVGISYQVSGKRFITITPEPARERSLRPIPRTEGCQGHELGAILLRGRP